MSDILTCNCEPCFVDGPHRSDCAVHNGPYADKCDCNLGARHVLGDNDEWTWAAEVTDELEVTDG
jgi:hypothetical protein